MRTEQVLERERAGVEAIEQLSGNEVIPVRRVHRILADIPERQQRRRGEREGGEPARGRAAELG